jgi:hypothetical protein
MKTRLDDNPARYVSGADELGCRSGGREARSDRAGGAQCIALHEGFYQAEDGSQYHCGQMFY